MAGAARPPAELRICADPYDLPFSNDKEEGFENKIAHVIARDFNATVINYWQPGRRGMLRSSILAGRCDVMIQAPVGLDPVATTKPYYRSTYYFVYRADRGLALRSLDDTVLKHLRIGVNMIGYDYTNTPPAGTACSAPPRPPPPRTPRGRSRAPRAPARPAPPAAAPSPRTTAPTCSPPASATTSSAPAAPARGGRKLPEPTRPLIPRALS